MPLTSPSNPRIKLIRKLRERKERQASGLFYVEGLRITGEAAETGSVFEYAVIAPELLVSDYGLALAARLASQGVPVLEVDAGVFKGFALKDNPQGIGAVLRQRWTLLDSLHPTPGDLWVALDSAQDPGNLGTILRTGDAAGAKGVILLDDATDPYDPTAMRASMGAIFSQALVKARSDAFAAWKRSRGVMVAGTSGAGSQDYHAVRYPDPLVLLSGSEQKGLPPDLLALCDLLVRIPMTGRSDSLNLAIATGVVLYEIFNQRRDARGTQGK